jgi:hypothetical protein
MWGMGRGSMTLCTAHAQEARRRASLLGPSTGGDGRQAAPSTSAVTLLGENASLARSNEMLDSLIASGSASLDALFTQRDLMKVRIGCDALKRAMLMLQFGHAGNPHAAAEHGHTAGCI